MKSQFVNDYADLRRRIRELTRQNRGTRFVFRGQLKFYRGRVMPSIARPGHESYSQDEHPFWYAAASDILFRLVVDYQEWLAKKSHRAKKRRVVTSSETGSNAAEAGGFEAGERTVARGTIGSHIEEILQHYGARSHYLDVTKSPGVALWFAHHRHRYEEVPLLPFDVPQSSLGLDPFGPMPIYDVAWYEPAWPKEKIGYLFILSPNPARADGGLQHGDYIDLTSNYMATRMRRQQAGLVYADPKLSNDLSPFVREVFRFSLPLRGAPASVTKTRTQHLFPPPDKDLMYREIISCMPFRTSIEMPFAFLRALRIPEYYQSYNFSRSRTWPLFRSYDRYFRRTFFLAEMFSMENPILEHSVSGTRVWLPEARAILCPLSIRWVRIAKSSSEFDFEAGGPGLFFEYDPIQEGMISQREYSGTNARGIWVTRDGNRFWCRVFFRDAGDDQMSLSATQGHVFNLEEGKGLSLASEPPPPESLEANHVNAESENLGIALGLLIDVKNGKRSLKPSSVEPYLFLTETHIEY
jgi:hypothetical protein